MYEIKWVKTINMSEYAQQLFATAKAAVFGLTDDQWKTKIQNFVRDARFKTVTIASFSEVYKNPNNRQHYRFCALLEGRKPYYSLCYIGKIPVGGIHESKGYDDFEEIVIDDSNKEGTKLIFSLKKDGSDRTLDGHKVIALYEIPAKMQVKITTKEKSTIDSLCVGRLGNFTCDNYVILDSTPPPKAQPTQTDPPEAFTAVGPAGGRRRRLQTTKAGKRRRRRGTARPRRRRR